MSGPLLLLSVLQFGYVTTLAHIRNAEEIKAAIENKTSS